MVESAEGIGGRKWSLLNEADGLWLMEGTKKLARLADDGRMVMHLLVTAPQLWAAANEVARKTHGIGPSALDDAGLCSDDVERLANAVAKAVNKSQFVDVLQS